jgi:hypothetical protein
MKIAMKIELTYDEIRVEHSRRSLLALDVLAYLFLSCELVVSSIRRKDVDAGTDSGNLQSKRQRGHSQESSFHDE